MLRPSIRTGSAGFHPAGGQPHPGELFGDTVRCRFGDSPARYLGASDVHQPVHECAGGQDDARGVYGEVQGSTHPFYRIVFDDELFYGVLPHIEVGGVFDDRPPGLDEFLPVALGARAPHGRPFGAVQHPELDGGFVGYYSHLSSQGVDLPDNLPFGNTSYGGVAAHLGDFCSYPW